MRVAKLPRRSDRGMARTSPRGAKLVLQIENGAPDADIIAERTLTQALINVLDNAADASPDHIHAERHLDSRPNWHSICPTGGRA